MNPARFLAQVGGAALGIWVTEEYVYANLPPSIFGISTTRNMGLDFGDVIVGAGAVLGAMAGNAAYSKFLGK